MAEVLLQFLPFSSVVSGDFWHKLSQLKMDVYALNDEPVSITGYYTNHTPPKLPACFNVDYSSFDKAPQQGNGGSQIFCTGSLRNTNTLEAFKDIDKQVEINKCGEQIWNDIVSGAALENPSLLSRFLLLTFADIKKHFYYYWFGFPALASPSKFYLQSEPKDLDQSLSPDEITQLQTAYDEFKAKHGQQSVFLVNGQRQFRPLSELPSADQSFWLGFCDPSSLPTNPGWPLRNALTLVSHHRPDLLPGLTVLCWRDGTRDGQRRVGQSLLLQIKWADGLGTGTGNKSLGWEKNERGKLGPRSVDLSATMNPERLAEAAVDLNLKLMKWRLLPELDLDAIHQTKCLLFGAGTLGCYVARTLMAWGIKHITFVDSGKVGYSNPVRQALFQFENCLDGGKLKAETAANALRAIFPGMNSRGLDLRIPMPGHSVGTEGDLVEKEVRQLEQEIQDHDVIFLLTDTRESRWLPTMLAAYYGKLVINAALGFDTFLVMRHGMRQAWTPGQPRPEKPPGTLRGALPGRNLGCYFCNDVVAPGDSTKDRTLDQQCTVTRPGIALIASGLAVELMVSVLQHPEKGNAAAEIDSATKGDDGVVEPQFSPLGIVPHSIRGFLYRLQQVLPATEAFYNCTACSPLVLERYAKDGYAFLLEVFNTPDCLERVSGLEELHKDIAASAVEDWDYPEESEASD